MRLIALVALLGLGCGSGTDVPATGQETTVTDPLVGLWQLQTGGCFETFSFDATRKFGQTFLCPLADSTLGVEEYVGTYSDVGSQLTLHNAQGTCPGTPAVSGASYAADTTGLVLTAGTSQQIFARISVTPGANGNATLGCFDATGNLTPSPLAAL